MLKGALALAIRTILLVVAGALASAGVITATGNSHYCFDANTIANASATAILLLTGGGVSAATSIGWRFWAKKNDGLT